MKLTTLSRLLCAGALALSAHAHAGPAASPHQVSISPLGSYQTGLFEESAAEIVAHDAATQRLFVVNASSGMIDVLDVEQKGRRGGLAGVGASDHAG